MNNTAAIWPRIRSSPSEIYTEFVCEVSLFISIAGDVSQVWGRHLLLRNSNRPCCGLSRFVHAEKLGSFLTLMEIGIKTIRIVYLKTGVDPTETLVSSL
jgi:hypothetical protein